MKNQLTILQAYNELYGDSRYIGAENREDVIVRNKQGKKIKSTEKPSQIKELSKSGQYQA